MNILYLDEPYADTLLCIGIGAAFGVSAQWNGMNYSFPDSGLEPIQFPECALDQAFSEPPFTYHRFKRAAINALGGRRLLETLGSLWNASEPRYYEIIELVLPSPTMTDWTLTRFHHGGYIGAATFRPLAMKGFNNTKAAGLGALTSQREIWLLDALRAIGFLTYAQPKLLPREAATALWLIFVPVLPDEQFSSRLLHMPDFIASTRTQIAAHLVASDLRIPRLQIAQYAELNPLARTIFGVFALENLFWPAEAVDLFMQINRFLCALPLSAAGGLSSDLLRVVESRDISALSRLSIGLAEMRMAR